MTNIEWYVMDAKFFDNQDGTYTTFVKLTVLGKEHFRGGANVKIQFKTKNTKFYKIGNSIIGRIIKIKDLWWNSEISNVCMKEKDSNGKYVFHKAYCNVCYFNDFEFVDTPPPQEQTTTIKEEKKYVSYDEIVKPALEEMKRNSQELNSEVEQVKKFDWDEDI